ncbi:FolC bifunctional protein [Panaeolus papilionaceus]|nr:FolC bifunctional protein [Panaeolus papilionaceus]
MSTKSYQDAVEHLNSLQSNAATLEAVRASGGRLSQFAIPEMLEYLERIGYTPDQLNSLNVIHIAGTKGKGSTSAFVDSIIRHAKPDWKIGLYTSPHLIAVRERIRINGKPLSESDFARYFFEVWDRLKSNNTSRVPTTPPMPGYFRFLTLMAFHVFTELKVDATVLEVGVGGTFDSTNIVPKPVVTGITALGIDHVQVLGKTLPEIAWQKSGIFKESVPAYSVDQSQDALQVIEERSKELKSQGLKIVPEPQRFNYKLGLDGAHQVQNATLAVELSKAFLEAKGGMTFKDSIMPQSFQEGLANAKWPGRCQTIVDSKRPNTTWYLDGAHTVESLKFCAEWFATPGVGVLSKDSKQILVFNCTSGRSGESFLQIIKETILAKLEKSFMELPFFDEVIFCTNVTYADGHFKGDLATKAVSPDDLKVQVALEAAWKNLYPEFPHDKIHVLPSIEHAVKAIEMVPTDSPVHILVTGSLHLVGGVIEAAGLSDNAF